MKHRLSDPELLRASGARPRRSRSIRSQASQLIGSRRCSLERAVPLGHRRRARTPPGSGNATSWIASGRSPVVEDARRRRVRPRLGRRTARRRRRDRPPRPPDAARRAPSRGARPSSSSPSSELGLRERDGVRRSDRGARPDRVDLCFARAFAPLPTRPGRWPRPLLATRRPPRVLRGRRLGRRRGRSAPGGARDPQVLRTPVLESSGPLVIMTRSVTKRSAPRAARSSSKPKPPPHGAADGSQGAPDCRATPSEAPRSRSDQAASNADARARIGPRGSSRSPTRRAASARARRRSAWAPPSPSSASRCWSWTSIPQGNASTGLGIRHEAREVTVYDVLAAEAPIEGAIVPDARSRTCSRSPPRSTSPGPRSSW